MLSNLSAMAGPFEVITNLELKEPSGVARANWPVTTGVPLPEGALKEAGDAVLRGADGKPISAQFEVLSRWIPGDGSIRWLLVDTQANLQPSELATFSLAKGVGRTGATSLRVDESNDDLTITTGPLRFRVDRNQGFRLFGTKVRFRLDGLPAGRLSFAVKSFDEESNISDLSNVVELEIRETEL
jgi:hypothetical protein